ncbi:MAG: phosphoglucomutase, partial [Desulfocapsaceae bacterium]|nr:phosphoglucomutase [Desulfocapsaceae bacterium]
MISEKTCIDLYNSHVVADSHESSDYFGLIKALIAEKDGENDETIDDFIARAYRLIADEITQNSSKPVTEVSFGTSGWRGILGKDIFQKSVLSVTAAIVKLYQTMDAHPGLDEILGVSSLKEARKRGCLVGHDNRFGGETLGRAVAAYLLDHGFTVYYCGETTTGVLSAALLELKAAFSVNLTPSHNPLEYGGYKYNAADAGPAASELTSLITQYSREIIVSEAIPESLDKPNPGTLLETDSFALWQALVVKNRGTHGIDYQAVCDKASRMEDLIIAIDSVHGASRLHIQKLLGSAARSLVMLRGEADVSFGGIAPEPSSENMQGVVDALAGSDKTLRIGAIIDPDGDRIRFSDGINEISMNVFGAMAYHFLHEQKGLKGMVAKTVATSNLANSVAAKLGEAVFEPKVGFKEFKPVIGRALVLFEESDGISIIGHTPEKDAYIGLLLALDMVVTTGKNLGEIRDDIERLYGHYYPARDGVEVGLKGEELLIALDKLKRYDVGSLVSVGDTKKKIKEVLAIDGRKIIFDDDSWLMI